MTLKEIADALDNAGRINTGSDGEAGTVIQLTDVLAKQIADELRKIQAFTPQLINVSERLPDLKHEPKETIPYHHSDRVLLFFGKHVFVGFRHGCKHTWHWIANCLVPGAGEAQMTGFTHWAELPRMPQ